ncbi:MAG: hypothetical protein ACXVZL_13790 [Gaiellaceae bacterium]
MRPRSANEWRDFWRDGGELELRALLREAWPPLSGGDDDACAWHATRIATLLGSRAPLRALVTDLGRIRTHELGLEPDPAEDAAAAERIQHWFDEQAA